MELRHFRYFQAIAHSGSITGAAKTLRIAQPVLSRSLRELELELSVDLVSRKARGIVLTAAGEAFLADVESIIASLERARRRCVAISHGRAGKLRFGFVGTATHLHLVSEAIRDFRALYPNVELELQRLRSEANLAALRQGQIDVAVCYHRNADDPTLDGITVQEENYLLAAPRHHRLATVKQFFLADLAGEHFLWYPRSLGPVTYDQLLTACVRSNLTLNVIQEAESEETLLELVSVGMGCTFVISSVRDRRELKNVVLLAPLDLDLMLRLEIVWRRESSNTVRNFLDVIRPLLAKRVEPALP